MAPKVDMYVNILHTRLPAVEKASGAMRHILAETISSSSLFLMEENIEVTVIKTHRDLAS